MLFSEQGLRKHAQGAHLELACFVEFEQNIFVFFCSNLCLLQKQFVSFVCFVDMFGQLCSDRQLYSGRQVVMTVSSDKITTFVLEIKNAHENESRPNNRAEATKH